MRVGFFVIKNHGIDWSIIENSFEAPEEVFGLPVEKKMAAHQSKSPSFMGYEEPYYTNVDRLRKGDSKEAITTAGSTLPQFITEEAPLKPEYKEPMTGYEHYNRRMRIAHS